MEFLREREYTLREFEALVLIGTLCEKTGNGNKTLVEKCRQLLRMSITCYEKKESFRILINQGIKSKNQKAIAECLDEIAAFIKEEGDEGYVLKKDIELFTKTLDMADKSVRENSLKVFAEMYALHGEEIWRLIKKDIPIKVKGLLEARFK